LPRGNESSPQHGSYCKGVNKDSYARPNWDEAQTFAYSATWEWIHAVESWANEIDPSFVSTTKSYIASLEDKNALQEELDVALGVSLWIKTSFKEGKGQDGHWKGPGSGNFAQFSKIIAKGALLQNKY
jgi:hypothetical protein